MTNLRRPPSMKLDIIAEDIRKSKARTTSACALANTVIRQTGATKPYVRNGLISFSLNGVRYQYPIPELTQHYIQEYDRTEKMPPHTVILRNKYAQCWDIIKNPNKSHKGPRPGATGPRHNKKPQCESNKSRRSLGQKVIDPRYLPPPSSYIIMDKG